MRRTGPVVLAAGVGMSLVAALGLVLGPVLVATASVLVVAVGMGMTLGEG